MVAKLDLPAYKVPEIGEKVVTGARSVDPFSGLVNNLIAIDDGNIFVMSYVDRGVMDVYDVDNGMYKYSFYIPPGGPGRYINRGRYFQQGQDTLVVAYNLVLPDGD